MDKNSFLEALRNIFKKVKWDKNEVLKQKNRSTNYAINYYEITAHSQ